MTLPDIFFQSPFAHRTLHDVSLGRPENSIIGAKAAIEQGYGIEIDLQMSKDGVPMVFHDYSLERLTGASGAIGQQTASELTKIPLLHGKEGIPTFESFLMAVDARVPLLVEIKDQDGALGKNVGPLAHATCKMLSQYDGVAALMSFNPHTIAKCAEYAPDIPRGLVTDPFLEQDWPMVPSARRLELAKIPDYKRVEASFISHKRDYLDDAPVLELRDAGAAIFCWTVRSSAQEKKARQVAHNITFEGYVA